MPSHRGRALTSWRRLPAARAAAYVAVPWLALAAPSPWSLVLLAVAVVVAATLLARDPAADASALLLIAAFTVCDLSPLSVSGSVIRLYQLSLGLVLVVAVRRRAELWSGLLGLGRLPGAVLAIVLALTVLTPLSFLWTISPTDTVVSSAGQLIATGLLVVAAASVAAGLVTARGMATAVWAMAGLSSCVAVLQFVVTVLTPLDLAVAGGSGVPWPRPDGLMTEAVWAALVAATGLALSAVGRRSYPRAAAAAVGVHVVVLVLTGSRAVLLGMLVGGVVWAMVAGRRHVTPARAGAVAAVAVTGLLVLAVAAPGFLARYDPRTVIDMREAADGGSAASRTAVYELVADELPERLPLGAGAGALNKLTSDPAVRDTYADGGELNTGRGTTNIFLGLVFDFGFLGAALSVALALLVPALALSLPTGERGISAFLAFLYLVDFQFNNGFRFGFVNVLLGVLIAMTSIRRRRDPDPPSATGPAVGQRSA